jgi:hypothetical protein
MQGASVWEAFASPLATQTQRRLSKQALEELQQLELLQDVSLSDTNDSRSCFFADNNQRLLSGLIYKTSMRSNNTCPSYQFIWKNIAIPRVKFFGWLLTKERINCKSNLLTKKVLQNASCDIYGHASETPNHIILGYLFAQTFWNHIGWQAGNIAEVLCLWESSAPVVMPKVAHSSLLLLICWELWKHRHDVVFKGMPLDHRRLATACRDSARQWRSRLPKNDARLSVFFDVGLV